MTTAFRDKRVLVTGGTGMIGRYLVNLLLEGGAHVRVASLDSAVLPGVDCRKVDLARFDNCLAVCDGIEFVFHLAGIKGSPLMAAKRPASFFVPVLLFNTNMMEAARLAGVKGYLYTSTIGVYAPAPLFREDDVWRTFPSEKDRFAGWAKRMGELQAEAYAIEYGWKATRIVRPANVYGRFDNFESDSATVVASLIRRALEGDDPLVVWGDGAPVRDFIHASDIARGMLLVMESGGPAPVNLGNGVGVSIRRLVETIVARLPKKPKVVWDASRPSGDAVRVMDIARALALGFKPSVSLEDGIADTMDWFRENRGRGQDRHDVFSSGTLISRA